MIKLDKTKVYDLSELTSEERKKLSEVVKNPYVAKECELTQYLIYANEIRHWQVTEVVNKETTNAKELFYTLENIQVDCRDLSDEQIDNLVNVFESNGFKKHNGSYDRDEVREDYNYIMKNTAGNHWFSDIEDSFYTITYEKFMELFGDRSVASGNNQPPVYSVGSGMTTNEISLSIKPEGVVKFLANKGVFLSPEDYKKLFE